MKGIFLLGVLLISSCSHHGHYMRYDTDGNGEVTKEEWEEKHDKKFNKKDLNGDGVLTKEELKKGHGHGKKKKRH